MTTISHHDAVVSLHALAEGQTTKLFGSVVTRKSYCEWIVTGSDPLRLLPAIDRLMSQHRSVREAEQPLSSSPPATEMADYHYPRRFAEMRQHRSVS